ncbi:hypothetical protein MKX01_013608 [Papaver californicum]|nr:hypothetical protein MKX01_032714 [Papaver californicum]KAI3952646.1 hypothetical protein MKX01_013608 [Papaver californicum]
MDLSLTEFLEKYSREKYDPVYDLSINYCDGPHDYDGIDFDDWVDDGNGYIMPPERTVSNDATILSDEKKKPNMSGTSIDTELILHNYSGDEEKTNMDIEDGASEENMATERKKKEKRKTKEHGVEPQQKDGFETAIEVKKNKKSL